MSYHLLLAPADNSAETVATDLEGTLFSAAAWEGMRDFLFENGAERTYKRFFLRHLPRYGLYKIGLVSREQMKENWILGLLSLFAGYDQEEMGAMGRWVVQNALWPSRRTELLEELREHLRAGRRVIITTGQIEPILGAVLAKLEGFEGIGTAVRYGEDGLFTGRIADHFIQGAYKAQVLVPFTRDGQIWAAYGDTEQDIPMLAISKQATAVAPDAVLRRHAQETGWRIIEDPQNDSQD